MTDSAFRPAELTGISAVHMQKQAQRKIHAAVFACAPRLRCSIRRNGPFTWSFHYSIESISRQASPTPADGAPPEQKNSYLRAVNERNSCKTRFARRFSPLPSLILSRSGHFSGKTLHFQPVDAPVPPQKFTQIPNFTTLKVCNFHIKRGRRPLLRTFCSGAPFPGA